MQKINVAFEHAVFLFFVKKLGFGCWAICNSKVWFAGGYSARVGSKIPDTSSVVHLVGIFRKNYEKMVVASLFVIIYLSGKSCSVIAFDELF